jgi:hypothetical protein
MQQQKDEDQPKLSSDLRYLALNSTDDAQYFRSIY